MASSMWRNIFRTAAFASIVGLAAPAFSATPADTLIMARKIDDIKSLDPAEVFEWGSGEVINNLYVRVMTYSPDNFNEVVGGVAESWTADPDGTTYTLNIREGMKFHSGNPVTAKDVEYSLHRAVHLAMSPVLILDQLGWTADNVADMVKATDDHTLVIKTAEQLAPSLVMNCMSAGIASVVDSEELKKHEKDGDFGYNWLKTRSAGSGAYKLVTWKPKDAVVMEANPDFYLGEPKLKRLIVRHVPEPAAQRLLIEKGDVDIARDLTADQVKTVRENDELKVGTVEKTNIYYLGLNTKNEILANPKIWEAMRWLIDYQTMSNTFLDGYFGVHQSILTGGLALEDKPFHLDVDKAKALLAEAGYPDGFDIDLDVANTDPFPDIGLSMQSTFAQAGINVRLVQSDMAQVLTKYRARNHELVLGIWSPDYIDPHSTTDFFVRNTDNSDSSANKTAAWRNAWDIPELSAITEQAMSEKDEAKRRQTYIEQQTAVQQDSPIIVMFQLTENTITRDNVSGFISGPSFDTPVYWTIEKGEQ